MTTRGHHDSTGRVSFWDVALSSDHKTNLWHDCPLLEYIHDPTIGILLQEDFTRFDSTDDYTVTQATTGTGALSTAAPGVLEIDSNSTTATQGANVQLTSGCAFLPAAGKDLWFEATVKVVDTYDKCEFFAGLSDVETEVLKTSAVNTDNYIGWHCVTDDGVLLFGAEKAGTAATGEASTTLVEATYVKLGFKISGVTSVKQYVDGVQTGTGHLTANIPVVKVVPSFVCHSGGTNDPILHVAGYRVFQLR